MSRRPDDYRVLHIMSKITKQKLLHPKLLLFLGMEERFLEIIRMKTKRY